MRRTNIFAALACALLIFSLLGCGTTNHLQSIQISSSNTVEAVTGTVSIGINGPAEGPIQLYVWGNYSNGKQVLLHGTGLGFQMTTDPDNPYAVECCGVDAGSTYLLPAPPDTIVLSSTGLLTAVDPSACSWFNSAVPPATQPAWSVVGSYIVTATYQGFTSPPVYVAMASAPGVYNASTNPSGECGPQSTQ